MKRTAPRADGRAVELARGISAAARELGISADPTAMQRTPVSIDALVIPEVMPFWRAVLGYEQLGDEDLLDPYTHGPSIWFQQMDPPAVTQPGPRRHLRAARSGRGAGRGGARAGGRLVGDKHPPGWWTLADAEGNEVDIATWVGRD